MKITRRVLGMVLSLMVAIVSSSMNVLAEEAIQTIQIVNISELKTNEISYSGVNDFEYANKMRGSSITAASLRVTPRANEILIEMSTTCSFNATKVGVREVYVQEKVWYGWKTIAQAADYDTNSNFFSGQAHCTNATKGKTYRVLCTHYAIESNGTEHTVANQSEEFVYN